MTIRKEGREEVNTDGKEVEMDEKLKDKDGFER